MRPENKAPACPLCERIELRVLEDTGPPYRVWACQGCELGFVYPIPDRATLVAAYDAAYYEPWSQQHVVARRRVWQRRLACLLSACPRGGRLLEVGAGDGAFVALAAEAGYQVVATELSDAGAREIRRCVPDAEVHVGELVDLQLLARSFDVATAWHCLEHMRDPFAAMREIGRLLKPGGVLLLAVPNRHNFPMAWLYRRVKGRSYPLFSLSTKEIHLFHFTPSSLRQALQQAGFHVLHVGWDNGMVEPLKRVVDYVAVMPYVLGGRLWTEALLVWARTQERSV